MQINIATLSVSSENPRKTKAEQADHDALVASLEAHGQPRSVACAPKRQAPSLRDHRGGRRFAAAKDASLTELNAELYQGDASVDEISTATNMIRAAMHPLDEAAVIASHLAAGETPATPRAGPNSGSSSTSSAIV